MLRQTISPIEKTCDPKVLAGVHTSIAEAEIVYILGYGFDSLNNKILNLRNNLHSPVLGGIAPKKVFYTNFGEMGRVNERVRSLLGKGHQQMFDLNHAVLNVRVSKRDVYETFSHEFDL